MDRLNKQEIEQILGIYAPFRVKAIYLDNDKETLTVRLEESTAKNRSLFGNTVKRAVGPKISWHHLKTGRFHTIIEIEPTASTFSKSRTLNPPAFLGAKNGHYTYQLEQTVLLAASKKIDSATICALTGIDRNLINQIIIQSNTEQQQDKLHSLLPLETDAVWRDIIKHEISFKTNLAPLKFLISKLQLNCINSQDDPGTVQDAIATLRQFFIKHKSQLKSEYAQIGVNVTEQPATEKTTDGKNKPRKKVTLTAQHPVWANILSGEIDLLSKNMGLNLYITQLKNLYRKPETSEENKLQIAKELLFYMKKNISKLKTELIAISKIVKQLDSQQDQQSIPEVSHPVWSQLLNGQFELNCNQMAYKLLLVKARSFDDKQQAIDQIREYFNRNMRILSTELHQIEQQIAIAS